MPLRDGYEKLEAAMRAVIGNDMSLHDRLERAIDEVTLRKEGDLPYGRSQNYHDNRLFTGLTRASLSRSKEPSL